MVPALVVLVVVPAAAHARDRAAAGASRRGRTVGALRPYAQPLTLLYLIVVLRTLTAMSFSTFVPVMLTRRGHDARAGRHRRVDLSVRGRRWADSSAGRPPIGSGRAA